MNPKCFLSQVLFWSHSRGSTLNRFESETCSVVSDSLWPHKLYSPWNSPDQDTGVGSLSLLQGIFPTQGSSPGLPHCRWILYQLSHKESPRILEWVAYPFSSGSSQPRNLTNQGLLHCRQILYQMSYLFLKIKSHPIWMAFSLLIPSKAIFSKPEAITKENPCPINPYSFSRSNYLFTFSIKLCFQWRRAFNRKGTWVHTGKDRNSEMIFLPAHLEPSSSPCHNHIPESRNEATPFFFSRK